MSIESIIRQIISTKGYITVDDMISISMSDHPSSYYRSKQPIGSHSDFITSPEISQLFGEMIGIWAINAWEKLDRPTNINLVEFGPGRGILMRDLLRATSKITEFHKALNIHLCEINPLLIDEQKKNLTDYTKLYSLEISYISKISDIKNNFPSIIIANEFFDALPIKQYIKKDDLWNEIVISLDESGNFIWNDIKSCKSFERHINTSNNSILEILSESGLEIINSISKYIKANKGQALIIDYGYDIDPTIRTKDQYKSTLQAIKNHKFHNLFEDLGKADISSHVDFESLKNIFITDQMLNTYIITQKTLLKSLGIEIRLNDLIKKNPSLKKILLHQYHRLTEDNQMGYLFKALVVENH